MLDFAADESETEFALARGAQDQQHQGGEWHDRFLGGHDDDDGDDDHDDHGDDHDDDDDDDDDDHGDDDDDDRDTCSDFASSFPVLIRFVIGKRTVIRCRLLGKLWNGRSVKTKMIPHGHC